MLGVFHYKPTKRFVRYYLNGEGTKGGYHYIDDDGHYLTVDNL